jgi:hypothetical protein
LAVGLFAAPASALELRLDLQQFNRLTGQIGPPEDRLRFDPDRDGYATERVGRHLPEDLWYSTVVRAGARLTAWEHYALTVQFDTGELRPVGRRPRTTGFIARTGPRTNLERIVDTVEDDRAATAGGQPIGAAASQRGFVREAYASADWVAGLAVDLGLLEVQLGESFIYDGVALGGRLHLDFEALADMPLHLTSQWATPVLPGESVSGWIAEVRVAWQISLLESIAIFAVGWWDDTAGFDDPYAPWLAEVAALNGADSRANAGWISGLQVLPPQSQTALQWVGASGEFFVGDVLLSGRAMAGFGHFDANNPRAIFRRIDGGTAGLAVPSDRPEVRFDVLGWAGDLRARWLLDDAWMIEGFGVFLSGARNPFLPETQATAADVYGGFVGIAPLLTHTNLFFAGGLNQTFNGRLGHTAGVLGHGAAVGGLAVEWQARSWQMRSTVAGLGAPVPSAWTGGAFYGVEIDTEWAFELTDWMLLSAEYDVLFGGNFWRTDRPIQRGILGVDFRWDHDV